MSHLDVRKLTEVVMLLASEKFDVNKKLDRDMFQHVVYVSNRVLMLLKEHGASWEFVNDAGKYLWRLFRVLQAYNDKQREVSLNRIIDIVSEFRKVFN